MGIELEALGTMTVTLARPIVLQGTPQGARYVIEIEDAVLEGERVRAKKKGTAAADWALVGDDGSVLLDVRMLLETDDEALVYVHYTGRRDVSEDPRGAPMYATPLFETGDERYAWLNKVQAVAKGVMEGKTLTYEVYALR